jgi:lysophospholipase L1-like esterase
MCNGQLTMYEKDFSARSASLTNATIFSLGGDHETASRRVFNGRISLYRMWDRDAWFSAASTDECTEVHRSRLRGIAAPNKRYLFVGDSVTGNRIIAGAPNPISQWPRLYGDNGTQLVATVNAAVSGKRCDELDAGTWATESTNGYTRLYLMCGLNDLATDASAATIEARITSIVSDAKALGMTVTLLTISPFGAAVFYTAPRQAVADEVNAWIMAGSAGSDYEVDAYSALDVNDDDALDVAFDYGDGYHVLVAGSQAIADAVALVVAP